MPSSPLSTPGFDSRAEGLGMEAPLTAAKPGDDRHGNMKRGHFKITNGAIMYKNVSAPTISQAIQLGIGITVSRLTAKPERDILMADFSVVEETSFPSSGTKQTPPHKFADFKFKAYGPSAFRYFRDLFRIQTSDFLVSLADEPLREVINPGASGSLFFLSNDDLFILKTIQHKEADFLQQLLPSYYMHLHQNPRNLLPKFFGLYCYQSGRTSIRLVIMNNLLPSRFKYHQKYDLKGSTFKRCAGTKEIMKKSPTYKDLDFMEQHPKGLMLDPETYDQVMKTIEKDVIVLERFKIMDYSLLLAVHNIDQASRENEAVLEATSEQAAVQRRQGFSAALEAIQIDALEDRPTGSILARNERGERLILFLGIIDILQSYRLVKKLEHSWKSMVHDGDTVSVCNPHFYARRFLDFFKNRVFKKMDTVVPRGLSTKKRKPTSINKSDDPEAVPPPYEELANQPSTSADAGVTSSFATAMGMIADEVFVEASQDISNRDRSGSGALKLPSSGRSSPVASTSKKLPLSSGSGLHESRKPGDNECRDDAGHRSSSSSIVDESDILTEF